MPNLRKFRVRELIKRELGEILRRQLPVESAGLVAVHDVILSADLRSATVFVGILGSDAQRRITEAQLHRQAAHFRGLMGHAVTLRYCPTLRFVVDDSIAQGDRVLAVLEQIEKDLPPA